MKILAAVARRPLNPFSIEVVEFPEPDEDEILVKIVGVGLCHSDLACRDRLVPVPAPSILGHEGAGVVEKVGSRVTKVVPGDHVVLTFASCGSCGRCQSDQPAYCLRFNDYNFAANPEMERKAIGEDGSPVYLGFFGQSSFAQYALSGERNTVKVRKDVPLKILGPLGCGVQTGAGTVINSLKAQPGSTIAIFGAGSVGLSVVLGAVVSGCSRIIAVDVLESRLEMARSLGATDTLNASAERDLAQGVRDIIPGGVDYIVETTAIPDLIRQATDSLGRHGSLGLVGIPDPQSEVSLNILQMLRQRLCIRSFIEGDSIPDLFIPQLIELYLQGRFPFDRLLSFYPFEQLNQAIFDRQAGKIIKPVLEFAA